MRGGGVGGQIDWGISEICAGMETAAASNGLLGRKEQPQKAVVGLLQLDPTLRLANLKDRVRLGDLARLEEGLRKAGVPE